MKGGRLSATLFILLQMTLLGRADATIENIVKDWQSCLSTKEILITGTIEIEWSKPNDATVKSNKCDFKAIISDPTASSFLVEYSPRAFLTFDPKRPFVYQNKSYLLTPKGGQITVTGAVGRTYASVDSTSNFLINAGAVALGYYYNPFKFELLSDDSLFSMLQSPDYNVTIKSDADEKCALKIHRKGAPESTCAEVTLDLSKGGGILSGELDNSSGKVYIENSNFSVISGCGIYFPQKSVVVSERATLGKFTTTTTLTSMRLISASEGNLLTLQLPAGTIVRDKRLGISYILGTDPNRILDDIKSTVDKLKNSQ